jgi:putative inorganic carbon (HCO3(-)) transporter
MLYLGLVAYLASIYLRPAEIFPSLSAFPLVFAIAVVVTGLAAASLFASPRNPLRTPGDKFLLAYVAVILVSQPWQGWLGGASTALSAFGPVVFAYVILRLAVNTESQLIGVIRALTVLMLVQAVSGIVQFHTGVGLGGIGTVDNGRIRGAGIFNDPNDLGLSLVMIVPYLMSSVFSPRNGGPFRRVLWASALVAVLLAIYYTNSRGAALGLAVVLAGYGFLHLRRFLAAVAVALVLLGGLVALAPSRMSDLSADEDSSQGRVQAWYAAISMFKAHPVFGIGFGGFTDQYDLVAHNSFVHTFAELGGTGGFCFVGLFYWYFRCLKRRAPPGGPHAVPPLSASEQAEESGPEAAGSVSESRERSGTPVPQDWFGRTLVPDVVLSGIGVCVCAFFLSRQYDIVLGVFLAIGATAGAIYQQQQPDAVPARIRVTDLVSIAALSAGLLATTSMAVRLLD